MRGKAPEARPGELPRFRVDAKIEVALTPEEDVEGPLEVEGFARDGAGEVKRLAFEPRVHESGKVDIEASVAELGLYAGTWELVFAVGGEGDTPQSWEELGAGGEGYEVVRTRVEIVPTP